MRRTYQRFGYSILIIGLVCALLNFNDSRAENPYSSLAIWFWFLLATGVGAGSAVLFLILRVAGGLKNKANFFYVFSTVLNLFLALFAIFYLYGSHLEPILFWFRLLALVGVTQMIDILSENIWPTQRHKDRTYTGNT